MPYKTKPYVYAGLGQAFRAVAYVINEDSIQEIGLLSGNIKASIKREGAGIVRVDDTGASISRIRSAVNFGNLRVTNSGDQHVFKNVPDISSFMAAVRGAHPDALPPVPPPQWHEGLTDNNLEDFEIVIPPISYSMFNLIHCTKFSGNGYPTHEVPDNKWIREGDIASHLSDGPDRKNISASFLYNLNPWTWTGPNTTNAIAPVSGKINWGEQYGKDAWGGRYSNIEWLLETVRDRDAQNQPALIYFFKIQPLKNQSIPEDATRRTYKPIIEFCETYLRKPESLNSLYYKINADQLEKDIEMMKRHKTIRLPITKPAGPVPGMGEPK